MEPILYQDAANACDDARLKERNWLLIAEGRHQLSTVKRAFELTQEYWVVAFILTLEALRSE